MPTDAQPYVPKLFEPIDGLSYGATARLLGLRCTARMR
jgi:hypothetical protein